MNIQFFINQIKLWLNYVACIMILVTGATAMLMLIQYSEPHMETIQNHMNNLNFIAWGILLFFLANPIWVIIIIGTFFLYKYFHKNKYID